MKARVIAAVSLLLTLMSVLVLPFIAVGNVAIARPDPHDDLTVTQPAPNCATFAPSGKWYYYFDQTKESEGSFGSTAVRDSNAAVKQELCNRIVRDSVFFKVVQHLCEVDSGQAWVATGSIDPAAVIKCIDWERSSVDVSTAPLGAWTLAMNDWDGDGIPSVRATSLVNRTSLYLMLYFKGGVAPTWLRLPCGFQPVFADADEAMNFINNATN